MIAHVARADEGRGRVVLRLGPGREPSEQALEAAVHVARAFESEIESLFVEDDRLIEMASFAFASEISLSGRSRRSLSAEEVAHDMRLLAAGIQRKVEAIARRAEVAVHRRSVRGDPLVALAETCAACGPWNMVALAEPLSGGLTRHLGDLFRAVRDATGIILVGPNAARTQGPVVTVVEDIERLQPMLRAASRLAAVTLEPVRVLLVARDDDGAARIEGVARLLLEPGEGVEIVGVLAATDSGVVAESLRRQKAGFVVAEFGGLVVSEDGDVGPLAAALECPLLLVR